MNVLEKRIIELSYTHQLSHISSCLNCVNLIDWIYEEREDDEPVCLDNSHAALALYVVLEKHGKCDAEEMIKKHGTHASRDTEHGIWVSGGSLGQVTSVSLGLALADPGRTVWLVASDGGMMEGVSYEAMRFARKRCPNLRVWIVFNSLGAYGEIELKDLPRLPDSADIHTVDQSKYPDWFRGLSGHYLVLNESQYKELML